MDPRALAVHSIDEFVFCVPELAQAAHFYGHFGLDARQEDGAVSLYTFGHPHRWGRILAGPRKKLLWLTFGIHAADEERFAAHFERIGVKRRAPPERASDEGLWVDGPDGLPLQLRVADKCSPRAAAPREFPPQCASVGRAPARSSIQPVRPLYLSHVLLFTADVEAARKFYEEALGLRLSDKSADIIAFLHSPHGSDHHLVALAKSEGPGLHHTSWCVPSIDAIGLGAQQMAAAGYERGWGVGRHVLGSNYFRYVRDPWGSWAEYSFDIDYIPAGQQWAAADHPPEDSFYVWGPAVPDDFVANTELG